MIHNGRSPNALSFDRQFQNYRQFIWKKSPTPLEIRLGGGCDLERLGSGLSYTHDNIGLHLWAFNAATKTYTLVTDLTSQFNRGDYLWQ